MTQYHAIGLLYQMRSHDRMALVKMVQQFANGSVKNPAAVVMLVRLAAKMADEDPGLRKPMYTLLEGWLRHKAEMVNFEAAKSICELRDVTDAEVAPAINGECLPFRDFDFDGFVWLMNIPISSSTVPHIPTSRCKVHCHPHSSQFCIDSALCG